MKTRNWSSLGAAQQKRYLGWGRRQGMSQDQLIRYYNEGGNLQQARGKTPGREYEKRRESEKARAGKWHPLTPAQVRHWRKWGATDFDLEIGKTLPQAQVKRIIKEQQENARKWKATHGAYTAGWRLKEKVLEEGGLPEVYFYYHGGGFSNIRFSSAKSRAIGARR